MNGWKLVPVEPTEEMLRPLDRFMRPEAARELLKEVLAAAPQPPALGGEPEVLAYLVQDSRDGQYSAHRRDPRGWAHGYPVFELVDRAHVAGLLAEADAVKFNLDKTDKLYLAAVAENDRLKARTTALEGLLRKQGDYIATLADNTFVYSSGIGSPLKTKEVNDAAYAALAHKQIVNAALAEGAKS